MKPATLSLFGDPPKKPRSKRSAKTEPNDKLAQIAAYKCPDCRAEGEQEHGEDCSLYYADAPARPLVPPAVTRPDPKPIEPAAAPAPGAEAVLPPGYSWTKPPSVLAYEFLGFLGPEDANGFCRETTGWARIPRDWFSRSDWELLGVVERDGSVKIERWCGDAVYPDGVTRWIERGRVVR